MAEISGGHLNHDDLESWSVESPDASHRMAGHVGECAQCTDLISRFRQYATTLRQLRNVGSALPEPDCPRPEMWARLAAGLTSEEESQRLLEHSVQCEACGEQLRLAAECFAAEESGVETTPIDEARDSTGLEVTRLASQLARRSTKRRRFSVRHLALAAGLLILLGGAISAWLIMRPNPIELTAQTLAHAYDSRPPFEYRLPGTLPGRPAMRRGSAGSVLDRPLPLLEAATKIKKALADRSPDLQWISLLARLDLLEGNYDEALESLRRLDTAKPNDPDVLGQLGSAYAITSLETGDNSHDFDAVKDLNRAVQLRPGDPEALYNLALLYTYRLELSNAELTWRRYLAIDSKSPWAAEARRHLDEVQKKKLFVLPR